MFKKLNKKGFTLAELLVVVAIIGVLVAISIPIFTSQLEKSREAVDEANLRSAYAVVMAAGLTEEDATSIAKSDTDKIKFTSSGTGASYTASGTVTFVQTDLTKWESTPSIGGIDPGTPSAKKTITYTASDNTVKIEVGK